jgi:O-methyltransferase involved in polyketide biosynthesis/acyl-coenzyme A thioesterase PaaI-like protein
MLPTFSDSFAKPLSLVPDAEDLALHRINCAPGLVSLRLRELVPLLAFVDCRVEEISPEKTVLSLPLLASAMNQNGTHQAAIFYLVADYALGVGMFGVLPGVYVTGVHDRCNALPVQYWLKRGSVRHLAPGTGRLRVEVSISPDKALDLRRKLSERGRGELTETVSIYQGGVLVAESEHTMGIYADVPRIAGVRANLFQLQNLKTSALMIAGLRNDPVSHQVAGDQGRAIAHRMSLATPQLPSLVRARTNHIGNYLQLESARFGQGLVLGVGLDPKPLFLASAVDRWFGIDLKDMLRERAERFRPIGEASNFVPVAGDLRLYTWERALLDAGFDPDAPTIVIAEGISMYLDSPQFQNLLGRLRSLLTSPETRIWVDHVTTRIFALDVEEVQAFLSSMTRLGEPFVNGFNDVSELDTHSWEVSEAASAADVLGLSEVVHSEYRFSILRPKAQPLGRTAAGS